MKDNKKKSEKKIIATRKLKICSPFWKTNIGSHPTHSIEKKGSKHHKITAGINQNHYRNQIKTLFILTFMSMISFYAVVYIFCSIARRPGRLPLFPLNDNNLPRVKINEASNI